MIIELDDVELVAKLEYIPLIPIRKHLPGDLLASQCKHQRPGGSVLIPHMSFRADLPRFPRPADGGLGCFFGMTLAAVLWQYPPGQFGPRPAIRPLKAATAKNSFRFKTFHDPNAKTAPAPMRHITGQTAAGLKRAQGSAIKSRSLTISIKADIDRRVLFKRFPKLQVLRCQFRQDAIAAKSAWSGR